MEWYERRPSDYKEDTWHLTLAEHGAYNLLLDHYYLNESPLPDQDRALASICNCSIEEWLEVKPAIMKFFTEKNGKLRNNKCDTIINVSYSKRLDGAKRSAKYRKTLQKVTRDKQPGDTSTGQDRTGQDNKEIIKEKSDEAWGLFPRQRRGNKAKFEAAFNRAIKEKRATPDEIITGVKNYVQSEEVGNGYAKGAAAWINDDRWTTNYSLKPGNGKSDDQGFGESAREIGARMDEARSEQSQPDFLHDDGEPRTDLSGDGPLVEHDDPGNWGEPGE